MFKEYVDKRNVKSALSHAALSRQYGPDAQQANNIGYLYLASGQYQLAKEVLELAIEKTGEKVVPGLAGFNLGVAELMLGHVEAARNCFAGALELWEANPPEVGILQCLFVPAKAGGTFTLHEKEDPDPLATVKEALATASMV